MYNAILQQYQTTFAERDAALAAKLKRLLTISPAHVGVPSKYWTATPDDTAPMFSQAIAVLRQIEQKPTPATKLRAMVDTCGNTGIELNLRCSGLLISTVAAIVASVAARARDQQWPAGDETLTADLRALRLMNAFVFFFACF